MDTASYYESFGLNFKCFDREEVFKEVDSRILDPSLLNLVVDYGPGNAWCEWNLGLEDASKLVRSWNDKAKDAQGLKTSAIFNAHRQQDFITQLLEKYNLSARLRASLLARPGEGNLEIAKRLWHWSSVEHSDKFRAVGYNTLFSFDQLKLPGQQPENEAVEAFTYQETVGPKVNEKRDWWTGIGIKKRQSSKISVLPVSKKSNQGLLPNRGSSNFHRYRNKAQVATDPGTDEDKRFSNIHYHPRMLRLWMWVIVTDDGTVISIHEPFPVFDTLGNGETHKFDLQNSEHIRRNLRMVLRCLSEVRLPQKPDTPNRDIDIAIEEGALLVRKTNESTGDLLFYYLFDDWYTTYEIVVKRSHPYSKDLKEIRDQNPQLLHIDKLHDIVRRLASLKRIYQSYEIILERLLQEGKTFFDEKSPLTFRPAAVSRIARLKYRVRHLAINEIEDCEFETQGLISLTYNRLSFRETKAVEKLSVLSVTLAKVTIIFLPLSLITSYFSMDVEGITGNAKKSDFWISASVSFFLTVCFLLLVNRLSKTLQGR